MSNIERWTIQGEPGLGLRTLVNVSGRSISMHEQVRVVRESDYDVLADQLKGAVEALEEISDDLSAPHAPSPDVFPAVAHALQVVESALRTIADKGPAVDMRGVALNALKRLGDDSPAPPRKDQT